MKTFFKIIISLFVSFGLTFSVFSQETTSTNNQDFGVTMVDAIAPNKIDIYFTDYIEPNSLRVTIENQTTKTFVNVINYEDSKDVKGLSHIYLDSNLSESTAYKLTVNSVISKNGSTITEGIDAIRDFVTPARFLNDSVDVLNAPDNKTAVVVDSNVSAVDSNVVSNSEKENTSVVNLESTDSSVAEVETKPVSTDNLPATGMETGIYIIAIIAILTIIMISSRKRV